MSQTILITGGAGFIGSNFAHYVLRERPDWSLINLDLMTYSGNPRNLEGLDSSRHKLVIGDICDRELVDSLVEQCDGVIHMAAESHVDRSIADASPFVRTNMLGTQVILDSIRDMRSRKGGRSVRMAFMSTDEVYGSLPLDKPELLFTEDSQIEPRSPYATTKAASDLLCQSYHHTYGMDIVTTRCSNNLGPRQFPEKVIPLFVTNLVRGKKVPLYGDGLNVRDWLHVDDHCSAVLAAFEKGTSGGIYNVGADNERSNLELTHAILELMGKDDGMIEYVEDRLGHDRRYAIDSSKIQNELGWRATKSDWPSALQETIDWYLANEIWWDEILRGEHQKQPVNG